MKTLLIFLFVVFCVVVISANEEKITDDELNELINDYKFLYKNYDSEKTAPVSNRKEFSGT